MTMGPKERIAILRSLAETLTGGDEVELNGDVVDSAQLDEDLGGLIVDTESGNTFLLKVEDY